MKNELKRNKVATTNQVGYVMQQKYNRMAPYDRFSTLYGSKKPQEYFITPIPDYVDVTYDFIAWCEYQEQLNYLVEQFIYFTGQSFGERNFFKFSTNMDSVTMEDNNTTGQDRVVRATFQITVHAYLLPKELSGEATTKRVVAPNKINFISEAYGSIEQASSGYTPLNQDVKEQNKEFERRTRDFTDISLNNSPEVYPTELE